MVGVGTCSITASQAGSDSYNAAPDVTQTFGIAKADQTIEFTDPSDTTFAPAETVSLTASASSGLDVSFASTTAGVCSVSGTSVTMVAVGTCSITASQAGNDNFNAATDVTQSFNIGKGEQTIDFTNPSDTTFNPSGTVSLTASASSGLAVTFASQDAAVCSVSGSTVTMVGAGTCPVTAFQDGNDNYYPTQVTKSFAIGKADQSIDFTDPSDATFAPEGTVGLTATASSGLDVSFASNSSSVCSVSGSTVTIVAVGTCSITASQAGSDNYNGATAVTQTFAIGKADQSIDFTDPSDTTFAPEGTVGLAATASSGLDIGFASNSSSVCTVSGSTVTMVGAGTCSITASQAGSDNYNPATDVTQTFAIGKIDQTIDFTDPTDTTFAPAGTVGLTATASSGLDVSFASNDASVCTVSGSTVTMVGAGTCSITASQSGSDNYNAATDVTQTFSLAKADQTIDFTDPSDTTFAPAGTVSLTASASSGLDVSFASNDASVCTVSGSTVTMVGAGTCSITASQAGSDNYNAATDVPQTFGIAKADQSISFTDPSDTTFAPAGGRLVSRRPRRPVWMCPSRATMRASARCLVRRSRWSVRAPAASRLARRAAMTTTPPPMSPRRSGSRRRIRRSTSLIRRTRRSHLRERSR